MKEPASMAPRVLRAETEDLGPLVTVPKKLQWGRVFLRAETGINERAICVTEASMGPRVFARGDTSARFAASTRARGFNGAARFCARRRNLVAVPGV